MLALNISRPRPTVYLMSENVFMSIQLPFFFFLRRNSPAKWYSQSHADITGCSFWTVECSVCVCTLCNIWAKIIVIQILKGFFSPKVNTWIMLCILYVVTPIPLEDFWGKEIKIKLLIELITNIEVLIWNVH